jgi:hypothetical protein
MVPEARPKVLLSVLLYAYAGQIFASTEIVQACGSNSALQKLCGANPPDSTHLESFRRKHRVLLEGALAEILLRVVRHKYAHLEKLPPGLEFSLLATAVDRLDTARHMDNIDA